MGCCCQELDDTFLGTKKKYLIEVKSMGFDMETDDIEIVIKRGQKSVTIRKGDLVQDEDGNFYVNIDTNKLGAGVASMTIKALVPDMDFEDGIRDEVGKFDFLNIHSV